ncbi:PREDICTED: uncharacterized protein LOC107186826 [Dufourea novaeangliae]|uniref:uncharacterized protein LOC107186826 n=1 Tax=Dufourea novaeangliae TaxID=178035 RepID=UPI0007679569|nr:PREDICTED: uncharacterized protein LOC107186826 [Dufourea novaeangliae]
MAGKGFRVKVRLELHAVTCPGVWLCPNGKVALRITSLGSTLESHRVSPILPLLFHNEFKFKKTFTRLAALTELQRKLEQEFLYAELIQWLGPCNRTIVLATFETNLADVLFPVLPYKHSLAGITVDLLMDPTKRFPGIIAPKIEISTRTVIEEVLGICDGHTKKTYDVDEKKNDSMQPCAHRKRPTKGIIRQRRVCHSRAKPRVQSSRPSKYRCESSEQPRIGQYHRATREQPKCVRDHRVKSENDCTTSAMCKNTGIFDNCPICSRYKCYFFCDCDRVLSRTAESERSSNDSVSSEPYDCYGHDRGYNESNDAPTLAISEYDTFAAQDHRDAQQGFYKNLERFYKQMYKQAKLRARETNDNDQH